PVRADPAIRAGGALVRAGARHRAAACALRPLGPELLDQDPEPHRTRRQERKADRGRTHVLDTLDDGIVVAGDTVAQLFDRRVEYLNDQDKNDDADQGETFAHVRRQEKSERDTDDKNDDLLPEGLFRLRYRNQPIPAVDRRLPQPLHENSPAPMFDGAK